MQEKNKQSWKRLGAVITAAVIPILLSGIVRALGIYIFVTPNKFAPGGTNGIAVLLEYVTKWNSGWFLLMINVPLFFLAFFLLGKREAIISTLSMLLTSGLLIVFDYIHGFEYLKFVSPDGTQPIVYGLLAAVAGGIFLGVALATMIKSCGTAGGTAVLASLVKKKWSFLSVSWLTSGFDAIVVFVSFFVYYPWDADFAVKLTPVLLALVSLVVTSKTSDLILQGYKTAYRFEIVTNQAEEIAKEIMETTHHGVTEVPGIGMYSHSEHKVLVCIIRKRHIAEIQKIIKKYPGTFASFAPTSEVYGKFIK